MFILRVLDTAPVYFLVFFINAYFAYILAGKKIPYRRVLLSGVPLSLFISVIVVAYYEIPNHINFELFRSVMSACEIILESLWIVWLLRDTDKKKYFYYASTVLPFGSLYTTLIFIALTHITIEDAFLMQGIVRIVAIILIAVGALVTVNRFVSKTSFWRKLQAFGNYPRLYIPMGVLYLLITLYASASGESFTTLQYPVLILYLIYSLLVVAIVLMVSDIKRTEQLNSARDLLHQQQDYIGKLETLQQEIRRIQHDYKNLLSGLYAYANEGNIAAVKEYIETKLFKVDEAVREDLRHMNQLTRIEIPELKGLILTKMMEAERDRLPFRVEVMFPVVGAAMETADLLRCVGILLDNAMEAVREARTLENAAVTLLLIQEGGSLTVVVKNPVQSKPDLNKIWTEGFSTKGANRGVGLTNYQNIVRKYPGTVQEAKMDENQFVQILMLAGNR